MIYLDTDLLIHFLVVQNKEKHRFATKIVRKLIEKDELFISLLSLQEIAFVLNKLEYSAFEISEMLTELETHSTENYTLNEFKRAKELALKIGFQNINDCLHTAIAESHCKELYTFNKNDFEQIGNHTKLKIFIF